MYLRVVKVTLMYTIKCKVEQSRVERMQPKAGAWLLGLRKASQITAAELAEQVGVDADDVAALESGRTPVPPGLYDDFAQIFDVAREDFAKTCLMYTSPSAYEALFGELPAELREAA